MLRCCTFMSWFFKHVLTNDSIATKISISMLVISSSYLVIVLYVLLVTVLPMLLKSILYINTIYVPIR